MTQSIRKELSAEPPRHCAFAVKKDFRFPYPLRSTPKLSAPPLLTFNYSRFPSPVRSTPQAISPTTINLPTGRQAFNY
jgi:hypothetical protein